MEFYEIAKTAAENAVSPIKEAFVSVVDIHVAKVLAEQGRYEDAKKIIEAHGYEKFLFGSDFPMWDHSEELERFNKLDLTPEQKEAILYKNAQKLLASIE